MDRPLFPVFIWFTSALFAVHASDTVQFKCSSGWEKIYERCYLIVPYHHTWNEALKYCQRQAAVLAEPRGFDLTDKLATEARNSGLQKFWIGYNRLGHTGNSPDAGYWSDGSPTGVEVGVWAPYEPQVDKGDCVYVGEPWDSLDDVSRWYFDSCTRVYPSVCERTPCPEDTYSCFNGRCVSLSSVCDGINTCGDSSDETHCPKQCSYLETGTSGQVESPRSGSQYSPNANCQWTIQGSAGTRIQVKFDRFETETDLDFVELWDGGATVDTSQMIARLSGPSAGEYATFISSRNWLLVRFITDGSVQKSGFNFTWSTDFECSMQRISHKVVSNEVDGDTITLGSRQTVKDCKTQCVHKSDCRGVQYDVDQQGDHVCFLITGPLLIQDDKCCDLYIKTCPGETSLKRLASVPLLGTTFEATSIEQFLYTPLYPLPYIGNMEVIYTVVVHGTRLIIFEILSVDLCCSDSIFFYDGPGPGSALLYTVDNTTEPGTVVSTTNTVYIHMQLLTHWSCHGALVAYRAGCDMVLTTDTGTIQSPGYGVTTYPGIALCSWLIKPTLATSIRLVFEDFDLEEYIDFLEIYEGAADTGRAIHNNTGYSGSHLPATIVTTQSLFLRFTTSAVGTGRGFKALYSSGCPQLSSMNAVLFPAADAYHAPDVVNMTCAEGYYFIGRYAGVFSVILTCLETGRWDESPIPECQRGYCGFAPAIENGYMARSTGVQGGDTTEYQCHPGFNATGPTTIVCLSDNQWEPEPQCYSPSCENLTKLYVADYIEVILGDGITHGSLVKITCPQNYQLTGPQTVVCVEGEWKQSLPKCERIPCPVPVVNNASLDLNQEFYVGNDIHVNCHSGYVVDGSTDLRSAEFSCGVEDPPQCLNLDECTAGLDTCVGAACVDTVGSYRCECLPGYQPVGASVTVCEDVDECSENLDFCEQECSNTLGSYFCSCYNGYDLYTTPDFNDIKLLAGEDGSKPWHNFYINHSCVLKKCDSSMVLELENGEAMTSKTSFFYGDTVEYICNVGYKIGSSLASSQTINCQQDGTWNFIPMCISTYCSDIRDPEALPAGNITYGATVQKECIQRNKETLILERLCGYDHYQNKYRTAGDSFICPETDCGNPPQIKGTLPYVSLCTHYNCTFTFNCYNGYQQMGTSSRGDDTVRCTEDGLWDFGDLTCQGGQCSDPGHPENGYTTFSSYNHGNDMVFTVEEGSIATFHCNREGYTPYPHDRIVCQLEDDGQLAWNGTVPECRDTTRPEFDNCPDTMVVSQYLPIDFAIPKASDNTAVYIFDVHPDNFYPGTIVDAALRVRYRAVDYQGLSNNCDIWIYLKDLLPPQIECNKPEIVYVTGLGVQDVYTEGYVNVIGSDVKVTAYPQVVHVDLSSVGTNPTVDYMAEDQSGNTAVCRIQLRIEGPTCDEADLVFKYENVTCSTVGSRKTCIVTCLNGYVFFENPTASVLSVFCENGVWSRASNDMPICTAISLNANDTSEPFYSVWYQLAYTPASGVYSDICVDVYQQQIQAQLVTLTNALETVCQITTRHIVVMQATNAVEVKIQNTHLIYVHLKLEIRPDGLLDSQYADCAARMLSSFNNKTTEVQSIENLMGTDDCAEITLSPSSADQTKEEFRCLSASKPAQSGADVHACLACPPGTFQEENTCKLCGAGTFNTAYYQQSCRTCPSGTNSKSLGLRHEKDCYNWCSMYLYSGNGLTPCTDCPHDTYWVDGDDKARCEPCPIGTNTNGRGARKREDCLARCQPGTYSATGLEPCLKCPFHYYQAAMKATKCIPCPSNAVTLMVEATSEQDCIDGTQSICASMPCKNNGTCEVKRHIFFCICTDEFTGRTCETRVTPCDVSPCINDGICTSLNRTHYKCDCPAGYSGDRCQIDGNQCSSNNCINNGTCIDQNDNFMCTCPSYSGFYGSYCQLPQNPCLKDPCLNDGECIVTNRYYRLCKCAQGFSGVNCEIDLDECTHDLCMNGGTCVDGRNSFSCLCPDGYHGTYCHLRDYGYRCPEGACPNGPKCVDNYLLDEKFCQCFPGSRYGSLVDSCTEMSECDSVDWCTNGFCISYDHGYHYKCKCNLGYAGSTCLINVDDCAARPCQNEATCVDGIDDYSCLCVHNGTGGKNCTDNDNGCLLCNRDQTASCVDTLDGYTCLCSSGYTGTNCETTIPTCELLPCQHNGTCSNPVSADQHVCSCMDPWTGPNCETEMDNCALGTECLNGGSCYSTSDGFICVCPDHYIGERCEEFYSICDMANPCVGNSTCTDTQQSVQCHCEGGYTGPSCETLIWFCSDTTCKNGGTCSVIEDVGVVCNCTAGYTGSDCSQNIDECANNNCPSNSVCVDGIDEYTCECSNKKIGEHCEKDVNYNFDYVISSSTHCNNFLHYASFSVNNTEAISVAFWARLSVLNRLGTILSLYGTSTREETTPDISQYSIKINGTHVSMVLPTSTGTVHKEMYIDGVNIGDGYWHHIAVTWKSGKGELTLYVNGEYNTQAAIGKGEILLEFGLLQLGMDRDEASIGWSSNYFIGRISQLLLFDYELSDSQVQQARNLTITDPSILAQEHTTMLQYTIDYSSHLKDRKCLNNKNCDIFNATLFPSVSSCPEDLGLVLERVSTPEWESAVFSSVVSDTQVKSNYNSGGATMPYGINGISSAGYDSRGNAAVCTFRLYNRRKECESPVFLTEASKSCSPLDGEEGSICQLECGIDNYSPTQPLPMYQSCSKYGMWNQAERLTQYVYPTCAASTDLTYKLNISLQYMTTSDCDTVSQNLVSETLTALKQLNSQHNNGLCQFEDGGDDIMCSGADISVECTETNKAELTVTLPWIRAELARGSVEEVLMISIADDGQFTFNMAIPDLQSLAMIMTPACKYGTQQVGDKCVVCGSGTYFNQTLLQCVRCPTGTYRTVRADTEQLSECTKCPGSETTADEGAVSREICHAKCFLGNFFNTSSGRCSKCPQGYYQDTLGLTYCHPCGVDQTTYHSGAESRDSCIFISGITTSTVSTSTGTFPDFNVGASKEEGLSVGVIVAIVLCSVIAIVAIIFLILFCCKDRLPCFAVKSAVVPEGDTPWKRVNKYGETNLRYVDYRLSDIRDYKAKSLDRIPIYPQNISPDGSVNVDMLVNVPIFTEKLDGSVNQKKWLMSTGPGHSNEYFDMDQLSERPDSGRPDSVKLSSDKRGPGSIAESARTGSERRGPASHRLGSERRGPGSIAESTRTGSERQGPPSRQMSFSKRKRPGRPPAVLSAIPLPQMLAPISHKTEVEPVQSTQEYIRPLPGSERPRQKVTALDYQDFLRGSHSRPHPVLSSTSQGTSRGSEKILLDSDEDDYR